MPLIKAAVCHAHGAPLQIEELTLAPPGPGQVEVTIEAVAICHSDISYAEGAWGGDLPAVYGHEGIGRISALGAGVTAYAEGDRVLVTLIRSCGSCGACANAAPNYCVSQNRFSALSTADGTPVQAAMYCGAFAERVVVEPSQLAYVPDSLPAAPGCLLSCGVVTGVGAAVNAAQVRTGETVVVIGAGGVGLNAIQGAWLAGAARIVAVDMTEEKLDIAQEFGATDGILATHKKPWAALRKIAPQGADVVMVATGALPAFQTAPRYLAPQGRMLLVGMPHSGAVGEYAPDVMAFLGQQIRGVKMGEVVLSRDIPWMIDLYGQGRLKLDELVSGTWRLDQINEAIADTKTGSARRNVIVF